MSVPTRRILDPLFGSPILRAANNGLAAWTKVNTLSQWQKGTGWQADLYGGVQTGDDWAAVFIPVNELRVRDFNSAMWSYYMTQAQTMGVNIVIWAHDMNDFSKRAEITQLANITGLGKAEGWNSHNLNKATAQFFFYGENTTGTGLTAGPPNYYSWEDFQADVLFGTWAIYRISLEYGWDASGTFDHVWVAELKLNGTQILIEPSTNEQLVDIGTAIADVETALAALGYEFTINGVNFNGYANIKTLTLDGNAEDDDPITLHDAGVDYQVGTGKVFIAFQALIWLEQIALVGRIGESDTADGAITKEVIKASNGTQVPFMTDVIGVFAAGKYVTAETDSASDNYTIKSGSVLYGVEVDA